MFLMMTQIRIGYNKDILMKHNRQRRFIHIRYVDRQ